MRDDVGIRANGSSKNETILIVDDQDQVLSMLGTVFSEIGYRVITAVDGQDAVDKFTDNVDSVDIILMDIIMPRKDGVEAYKEICSLKPNVLIVFMSGFTANHIEGLNPDAINIVHKPISPPIIAKRIRETLDGVYQYG